VQDIDRPTIPVKSNDLAWKSDVVAELLRRSKIPFVVLNPGASYRGLHDSLVNYLGNTAPQMLLCLNEDHVVSIAHGYAKATDQPLASPAPPSSRKPLLPLSVARLRLPLWSGVTFSTRTLTPPLV